MSHTESSGNTDSASSPNKGRYRKQVQLNSPCQCTCWPALGRCVCVLGLGGGVMRLPGSLALCFTCWRRVLTSSHHLTSAQVFSFCWGWPSSASNILSLSCFLFCTSSEHPASPDVFKNWKLYSQSLKSDFPHQSGSRFCCNWCSFTLSFGDRLESQCRSVSLLCPASPLYQYHCCYPILL